MQLQQFVDPACSQRNKEMFFGRTELAWAGPEKLADTPDKDRLHCYSRYCDYEAGKMCLNRLEASHGVFIVFFFCYILLFN